MALQILDPTVAAAVAAATNQEAQRGALFAPFGSADVTVRSAFGATTRDIVTYGAWQLNSATPRGAKLGALLARTVASTGACDRYIFRAGSTDIFSVSAADAPSAADSIVAAARTNMVDPVAGELLITANPALPVTGSVATALTLSVPNSGTNGVPATITVTPNGPIPTGGLSVTLAASNGGVLGATGLSFTGGATAAQSTTLTRSTAGTSVVTMTNSGGLANTGSPANFTSAAAGATVTTLTLTSATTATAPFSVAQAFKQGDIPAGAGIVVTGATAQAVIKNAWPDGSAKIALISGTANLTASVPATVNFSAGAPPGGTSLTTADLKATGITANISAGAFGDAAWADTDWDTPFQTWVAGPRMSSWLYRKPIGGDAHLVGWLEVRLFAGGAVEVLPWVENGYLTVAAPTNKNATYTFTLGGTQRFTGAIDLPNHCRTPLVSGAALSHWLGADPAVVPKHDAAYMQATRLVPSYEAVVPSNASAVTGQPSTYTPLQLGSHSPGMGGAGYHPSIGLLPQWDVLYLVSAAPSLWAALQRNAYGAGRYGIHFRDENTNRPIRFSERPTLGLGSGSGVTGVGSNTAGTITASATGTVPPTYGMTHHPSMGFMAYLVTGRMYHLETAQFVATVNYLKNGDTVRGNANGIFVSTAGANTTRGVGWAIRSLAQAAAITPDADALAVDLRASLVANIARNHSRYVAQANNPQGFLTPFVDYTPSVFGNTQAGSTSTQVALQTNITFATDGIYLGYKLIISGETRTITAYVGATRVATVDSPFTVGTSSVPFELAEDLVFMAAPWQQDFVTAAFGYAKSLGVPMSAPDATKLTEFFAWKAQNIVGRLGAAGSSEYLYRDAAPYTIAAAPSSTPDWSTGTGPWYANWGQIYAITNPTAVKEIGDGTLRGGNFPDATSYWGNLQPALAYAVEHGAAGAAAGYLRMIGASNWPALVSNFNASPEWSVKPPVSPAMPVWYPASPGQAVRIPGTGTLRASTTAAGALLSLGTDPADIAEPWSGGVICFLFGLPYLLCYGGGHGDSSYNGIHIYGPLVGPGSDTPTYSVFLGGSARATQNNEQTYTDGRQCSVHSYNMLAWANDKMYCLATNDNDSGSTGNAYAFTQSGQTVLAVNPTTGLYGTSSHYNGKLYYIGGNSQFDRLRIYNIATDTWTSEANADIAFGNYVRSAVDTLRGKLLVVSATAHAPTGGGAYWDLTTLSRQVQITAPPNSTQSLEYDADRDVFVSYQSGSLTVQECSAATLAAGGGAVWVARTFTGTNPVASPVQGTFGRFRYVPGLKGYIVVPTADSPAYFFRSA